MLARPLRHGLYLAIVASLVVSAAACGDDDPGTSTAGVLSVETSLYPLQWMVEQVGGEHIEVANLTKPGTEPHDLELTPGDVADLTEADVVVYLEGFQPAVDDAVDQADSERVFDAGPIADLDLTYTPIEEGKEETEGAGSVDPHFWLDPMRLASVADAFAEFMGRLDPDDRRDYTANAATLRSRLDELDGEMKDGLADCESDQLVTSHNAFGYLARRYGLDQVGIAGLSPEAEPSPADLADISDFARANDVRTIYFETLVSRDLAETVAAETGATTRILDPIEGLNDQSQGSDYLEVMRSNLRSIRAGQPCT